MLMKFIMKLERNRIFIDSSAWLAFMLQGEPNHKEVVKLMADETKSGTRFFTCDYVLDEVFTRLITTQGLRSIKKFDQLIKKAEEQKQLLILWTDATLFKKAWGYFVKFHEHKLSFTDSLIVAMVKDFKINIVLSLDQGFKKVGFNVRPLL